MSLSFSLQKQDGDARACEIKTSHSTIQTPVFMPVGTQASVKSLDAYDLEHHLNADIILANTYHLYLRPSPEVVEKMGGLHKFTNFNKSFLTDSGGFQAFSLASKSKQKDDGIEFKSHIDGSKHFFTPEKVLDIQYALNSDIMMVLDDLIALPSTDERIQTSIQRTSDWAKKSLLYHNKNKNERGVNQNLFAIIQGGVSQKYRQLSAKDLCEQDFDGFAIGGLSVGESNDQMYDTVEFTTKFMPKDKPRYLMGVGTPEDLVENVSRGIDMFDCVMPTRNARNGTLFTSFGRLNIKSVIFKIDDSPIDKECSCFTCKNYSRAYMSHLFRTKELTYYRLASLHNLYYYMELMREMREAILQNNFDNFKQGFYAKREKKSL